jgi:hypothetical protein
MSDLMECGIHAYDEDDCTDCGECPCVWGTYEGYSQCSCYADSDASE